MSTQFKGLPLHSRVVVKTQAAEEKTAGGIIIPDSAKEKPLRGVVVAHGPGTKDEPMEVRVGDNVLFGKYAGTDIQIDEVDYVIMKESDILIILNRMKEEMMSMAGISAERDGRSGNDSEGTTGPGC